MAGHSGPAPAPVRKMKLTATASTLALVTASAAHAGGMAPPVQMQPAPIVQETKASSSSAAIIIPLILIALIALASRSSDTGYVAPSDARLKTDIRRTGTAPNGLPLYQFRYRGFRRVYEGVMAQDVLQLRPDAVIKRLGYYLVDYGKLGLEMKTIH
ncbi:MAG: hypothetical protein GC146_14470 [Limimaricola sp.]|uniref:tail fiber domain-containing protein n=1 Tax=Limimaricola sp. TaxID=2211665 RepID=UPI001DC52332|nr:tail fiber domain-containing protein [Limimaricola sp.]MBI1418419.1 hypothetical protein [Limimaricola sp.]